MLEKMRIIPPWIGMAFCLSFGFLAAASGSISLSPSDLLILFLLLGIVGFTTGPPVIKEFANEVKIFILVLLQSLIVGHLLIMTGSSNSPLWGVFVLTLLSGAFYLSNSYFAGIFSIVGIIIFFAHAPELWTSFRGFFNFFGKMLVLSLFGTFFRYLRNSEINMIKMMEEKVAKDYLTGLYSRGYLVDLLKRALSKSRRYKKPFALVMIDLDHFKKLNDTLGHQMGDKVLSEFGRFLRRNLRATDIPVRYGGDEFLILLPETDDERANIVIEKLRDRLNQNAFLIKKGIGMSAGVSVYPQDGEDLDTLLKIADGRLYKDKERRKRFEALINSVNLLEGDPLLQDIFDPNKGDNNNEDYSQ